MCNYCGSITKNKWCGKQNCLYSQYVSSEINYRNNRSSSDYKIMTNIWKLVDWNTRLRIYNYFKPFKIKKQLKHKEIVQGNQTYNRVDWIHGLSVGDREYINGKGITEKEWDSMNAIAQTEWKEECKEMSYYKNDKFIKQLI